MLPELQRIFPGLEIARIPASVLRAVDFAIERRPDECPPDFRSDRACHVVAGPSAEIARPDLERRAQSIAKHPDVTIIPPELPPPGEAPPMQ
jgi:hypothetical protein